jgi:hypothetical protein
MALQDTIVLDLDTETPLKALRPKTDGKTNLNEIFRKISFSSVYSSHSLLKFMGIAVKLIIVLQMLSRQHLRLIEEAQRTGRVDPSSWCCDGCGVW